MASLKIPGIYKIQSICKPERFYIGSSVNLRKRKIGHFNRLRNNKHHSIRLQNHFNKHGLEDLVFIIIEPCLPEFLLVREQYYLDTLNPWFNTCKIAGNTLGVLASEETKRKLSKLRRGINNSFYGKHHSEETKKVIKEKRKNQTFSDEVKRKMSLTRRGENNPNYGKHLSDDAKRNISEASKGNKIWLGRHHTIETKIKLREKSRGNKNCIGRKYSIETREKMRESLKKYYANISDKELERLHKPKSIEHKKNLSEAKKRYHANKKLLQLNLN